MEMIRNRRGVWLSSLLLLVALVLIAVLATLFEQFFGAAANPDVRTGVSAAAALLPPVIWLLLFYGLDRVEPEPKEQILKMAVLGALVQKGVFSPLLAAFPAVEPVSGFPRSVSAYAGILLMVVLREILKLMALRYGMMRHEAFNEKTDGILYGSAIGLGFSAMMNLDYVASAGGALLSAAVPQMAITSLIQASLGGLGGYWLGLAVFSRQPRWRLPLYLVCLGLLSGIMQMLPAVLVRQGFRVNYLIGMIPSAAAVLAIFLVLILLIRRDGVILKVNQGDRRTRHEGWVLGVGLALTLISAFILHAWQERLIPVSPLNGVTMSMPAQWSVIPQDGESFTAGNRFSAGEKSGFMYAAALPEFAGAISDGTRAEGEDAIHGLAAWWTMKSAREAAFYQPVHTEFLFRDGQWLAVIESLRLESGQPDASGSIPVVLRWRDVVWIENSDAAVISLYATGAGGEPDLRLMDRMVAAMRFGLVPVKGGGAE